MADKFEQRYHHVNGLLTVYSQDRIDTAQKDIDEYLRLKEKVKQFLFSELDASSISISSPVSDSLTLFSNSGIPDSMDISCFSSVLLSLLVSSLLCVLFFSSSFSLFFSFFNIF